MQSVWRTTCPVCRRPTGRARHCPYCDEPLPPTAAARQLGQLVAILALAGLATMGIAPPSASSLCPLPWPSTVPWLTLAGLLGAVSGLCRGVPLPVLVVSAGLPALPRAAALGAYAAMSAVRLRGVPASDPTGLAFAAEGATMPAAAAVVAAGGAWVTAVVAYAHPRACLSVVLLARLHVGWLLAAALLAAALLAPAGAAAPPFARWERLRDRWGGVAGSLAVLAVCLALGAHLRRGHSALLAAAAGAFAVAPLLWRAVTGLAFPMPPATERPPLADVLACGLVLALLAVAPLTLADDPFPPLFAFAASATVAALARTVTPIRRRLEGRLTRFGWIPSALVLLWACATAGMHGMGLAALSAALVLWAGLWAVPAVLLLALWLPALVG